MTRFFVEAVEADRVVLSRADSHHLLRVMRAQEGEAFTALSGGMQYACRLIGVEDGLAVGQITERSPGTGEPPVHITLFQGLAKGEKMESVIQHGTEVGISRFVPVQSARTVVKLDPKKAVERVERWQRIAREAAEQCRRGAVPPVESVLTWREAAARSAEFELALVPWEEGGIPLRAALRELQQVQDVSPDRPAERVTRRVALFIGPEGGLSAEEVALARQHGAQPVTLGPRILRTETAGLAAAAAILFALGDLG